MDKNEIERTQDEFAKNKENMKKSQELYNKIMQLLKIIGRD